MSAVADPAHDDPVHLHTKDGTDIGMSKIVISAPDDTPIMILPPMILPISIPDSAVAREVVRGPNEFTVASVMARIAVTRVVNFDLAQTRRET